LRLDLAQYRALAAFAQFASDLDRASQSQLRRGQRLTEILKQNQYKPLPVEKQIVAILAGTLGLLDDLEVEECRPFEAGLYEFMDSSAPEIGRKILEKKQLDDPLRSEIRSMLEEYKKKFKAEREAAKV
jgi:F-type H+-transporting ATPase subunit alpha